MTASFSRAKEYIQMLAGLAASMSALDYQTMLPTLTPYRSRGKGRGYGFQANSGMTNRAAKCNNAYESPGHQGAREMARRVRQQEKRDAKNTY